MILWRDGGREERWIGGTVLWWRGLGLCERYEVYIVIGPRVFWTGLNRDGQTTFIDSCGEVG